MGIEGRPVRWGILGCGMISHDFVSAALALDPHESTVVACAARKAESAAAFAKQFEGTAFAGSMRSYGSYDELLADAEVDVVYIGTLAETHEELCLKALRARKHVLVEKPITLDAEGARRVTAAAREQGLFLMEGMWTRCFPAARRVRELLREGAVGEVVAMAADLGWPAVMDPAGPHARLFNSKSGGAALDVAVYPLAYILLGSNGASPSRVAVTGTVAGTGEARVDWSATASLSGFPAPADPCLTASVLITLRASTPEEAVYTGTKGILRVHRAAHTPTRLTLTTFSARDASVEESFDFPLPAEPEGAVLPWNYPGSQGFIYEAQAVVQALKEGRTECPDWTHAESVACMELVGAIRQEVLKEC